MHTKQTFAKQWFEHSDNGPVLISVWGTAWSQIWILVTSTQTHVQSWQVEQLILKKKRKKDDNIILLQWITSKSEIKLSERKMGKLTSFSSHFCWAPTNVFLPLYWQSSSFTAIPAPCKHSSFWILCLISWRVEYSKYWGKQKALEDKKNAVQFNQIWQEMGHFLTDLVST